MLNSYSNKPSTDILIFNHTHNIVIYFNKQIHSSLDKPLLNINDGWAKLGYLSQ